MLFHFELGQYEIIKRARHAHGGFNIVGSARRSCREMFIAIFCDKEVVFYANGNSPPPLVARGVVGNVYARLDGNDHILSQCSGTAVMDIQADVV